MIQIAVQLCFQDCIKSRSTGKEKKYFWEVSELKQTDTKPAAVKGQKLCLFLPRTEEKRDFRSLLINQAVIMAPMPSCRLEGSRHPVTQRPGPRGQSSSQNSTPGQTPWANCPSQCQPFQCPPPQPSPLFPLSLSFLSFFSPSLPTHSALLATLRSSPFQRNWRIYTSYISIQERVGRQKYNSQLGQHR